MKRETIGELCVFIVLVSAGVLVRVLCNDWGQWNFSPVAASALFAGFYLRHRWHAILVPILIMAVSNVVIDQPYQHTGVLISVYAAMALPVLFRSLLRQRCDFLRVAMCAVGSSLGFYFITNFAHWYFFASGLSLGAVYLAGLPFMRFTLFGDFAWSLVFFGCYFLATYRGWLPSAKLAES